MNRQRLSKTAQLLLTAINMALIIRANIQIKENKATIQSSLEAANDHLAEIQQEILRTDNENHIQTLQEIESLKGLLSDNTAELRTSLESSQNQIQKINTAIADGQNNRVQADPLVQIKKNDGVILYKEGRYEESYRIFNAIVQADNQEYESRFYRIASLFHRNKLDSSNYQEILKEIEILERVGFNNIELIEIREFINKEQVR